MRPRHWDSRHAAAEIVEDPKVLNQAFKLTYRNDFNYPGAPPSFSSRARYGVVVVVVVDITITAVNITIILITTATTISTTTTSTTSTTSTTTTRWPYEEEHREKLSTGARLPARSYYTLAGSSMNVQSRFASGKCWYWCVSIGVLVLIAVVYY